MENPVVKRYQPHKGSILKVAINSNYIVSASEDKTVAIWDQRKENILKTVKVN